VESGIAAYWPGRIGSGIGRFNQNRVTEMTDCADWKTSASAASAGDALGAPPANGRRGPPPLVEIHRLLVESVVDYGIFVLDPGGHVRTWNEGAERIKGYMESEILGKHFSIFYPPEDAASGKPALELEVAAREGRLEDEGWRLRKDGSRFWANVVITALRDGHGRLVGFAKVTRDLTERRSAELKAFEDALRLAEIEAANRAKADFLATMSHELRTPLNAIGGYVDLLVLGVRGPLTKQQLDDLERIRRNQRHLLGIINDLLNFSRIEAGRVKYDIGPVHLCEVVERVRPMVEAMVAERGLALEWPSGPAPVAHADGEKVEQILVNLLSNAAKFTPPGGRITVSCAERDGTVRVIVTDTGPGIPSNQLETIFDPFVQLGRSLSSEHEGAGLGLAISRDLAHAMGGDLGVRSEPGRGSAFTLSLPRGAGADPGRRARRCAGAPAQDRKE